MNIKWDLFVTWNWCPSRVVTVRTSPARATSCEQMSGSVDERRAPSALRAAAARTSRCERDQPRAPLCRASTTKRIYRNIRIKRPLSIVDSLLSSDSLTSSVKFSVCVRYEFSSFFTVYVYYCRCFIYVSFIGFTSTESF